MTRAVSMALSCLLAIATLSACDDSDSKPDAALRAADGGERADAGKQHRADAGYTDAGRSDDSSMPSTDDAGSCVASKCPTSTKTALVLGDARGDLLQSACCIASGDVDDVVSASQVGECGVLMSLNDDTKCRPIVSGKRDESCLDTVVDGKLIQGCRGSNGRCGHLSPGWGCHEMFRAFWRWNGPPLDTEPGVSNPFNCIASGQACSHTRDCCAGPNGGICAAEAVDDDAGPRVGVCGNPEEYAGYDSLD